MIFKRTSSRVPPGTRTAAPALASRRQMLFGSAAAVTLLALPGGLRAALSTPFEEAFLDVSRLLINHRLNPAVGARIAAYAQDSFPDCAQHLDAVTQAAAARGATTVEAFFDDIPEGPLKDFCHWVIAAWYTGSSSGDRDATLFTYEEALLYQPTIDMVAIPSFGFSAPNGWGNDLFPLTDLPRF